MKQTTKNLYIIGLCIFCLGEIIGILKLLYELFVNLPNGSLIGVRKEYISTLLWTTIISIVIKMIIAFIIVFMITRILKNVKSKCLIPLFCCSIIFLIINLTSFSLPAIPKYLIYSKLGKIETYLVYFVNYLTNGTIFSMVAYIIILVASIKILREKRKGQKWMDNLKKKCEHCGATYIVSDGYCKQCWKRIPTTASPKEELLDGVKKADWHFFIDKNVSRYVDIYTKNEGKKFFVNWNWAAFFFGFNWLCYRKMYKFACLYIVIDLILTIVFTTIGVGIYAPKLEPHYRNVAAYEEAVGVDTLTKLNPVYSAETSALLDKALDSQKEIERIALKIGGISSIGMLLCGILFGIFADSIYKIHILKNIKYTDGGTSILAFFVGGFAYRTIYSLLTSPLISLLMDIVL